MGEWRGPDSKAYLVDDVARLSLDARLWAGSGSKRPLAGAPATRALGGDV